MFRESLMNIFKVIMKNNIDSHFFGYANPLEVLRKRSITENSTEFFMNPQQIFTYKLLYMPSQVY